MICELVIRGSEKRNVSGQSFKGMIVALVFFERIHTVSHHGQATGSIVSGKPSKALRRMKWKGPEEDGVDHAEHHNVCADT